MTVDVDGDVDLHNENLIIIPVKFNIITGYFSCNNNKLTSLKFAPNVIIGRFWCHNNRLLTSLEGAPKNKLKQIIEDYPDLIHTLSTEDLLEII